MPQLSLYIDKETLHKIEIAARLEHVSLSRWVREKLNLSINKDWPKGYFDLFGSIKDASFKKYKAIAFRSDVKRQKL